MYTFWPQFLRRDDSNTFTADCTVHLQIRCTSQHVSQSLVGVCLLTSAKPGNEVECRICGGWVKCWFNFKPIVHKLWRRCMRPIIRYITFHSDRPLKLPLSREVVEKGGFCAPDF